MESECSQEAFNSRTLEIEMNGSKEPVKVMNGSKEPVKGMNGSKELVKGVKSSKELVKGMNGSKNPVKGMNGSKKLVKVMIGSKNGPNDCSKDTENGIFCPKEPFKEKPNSPRKFFNNYRNTATLFTIFLLNTCVKTFIFHFIIKTAVKQGSLCTS